MKAGTYVYVIESDTNEYGERHIQSVKRDLAIHHKSGVYVTEKNGFVKDTNVMLTYTAKQLQKLVFENAYNGYYSKTLYNQFRAQRLIEDTLLRNKMMSKLRDIA